MPNSNPLEVENNENNEIYQENDVKLLVNVEYEHNWNGSFIIYTVVFSLQSKVDDIQTETVEHKIKARFSRHYEHMKMINDYLPNSPKLPKKYWFNNLKEEKIRQRCVDIQNYYVSLFNSPHAVSSLTIRQMLNMDKNKKFHEALFEYQKQIPF
eukprot:TRINITY_DN15190_c0_g1_i1.p1 TRINITY_DN15190_c0_g1~~TRINITY_DN15190_c0_g1_i1.p1  ORF type:complete len:154 (-),score=33.15 TRINITY_DN15190_c0_g1_i1:122-583(-)